MNKLYSLVAGFAWTIPFCVFFAFLFGFNSVMPVSSVVIARQARSFSVSIESHGDTGTGSIVFGNDEEETIYVVTCAHVVENSFKGDKKVKVAQYFSDEERTESEALLIAYCWDEDIAILKMNEDHSLRSYGSLRFFLEDEKCCGEEILHIGNFWMANRIWEKSISTGIINCPNRKQGNMCLDQLSCNAFPGSSGGAVVLRKDGRYVGMVSQGLPGGFTLMVPVRRILGFASRNGIDFQQR